jgi:ornithine decarboxylase
MGGGLPVSYSYKPFDIEPITDAINQSIARYIPEYVNILAEPGRSVSASSSVIVSKVIGREIRAENHEWLFLDMGVFQGLMEPLEMPSWRYPIFTHDMDDPSISLRPFTLTGPTCDAYDTIGFDYFLPDSLAVDDRIYIGATGAYTTAYASRFNGFEPPKTYYIEATDI